jgi:hypothetical protein
VFAGRGRRRCSAPGRPGVRAALDGAWEATSGGLVAALRYAVLSRPNPSGPAPEPWIEDPRARMGFCGSPATGRHGKGVRPGDSSEPGAGSEAYATTVRRGSLAPGSRLAPWPARSSSASSRTEQQSRYCLAQVRRKSRPLSAAGRRAWWTSRRAPARRSGSIPPTCFGSSRGMTLPMHPASGRQQVTSGLTVAAPSGRGEAARPCARASRNS